MTVQELIDELLKIEDKTNTVVYFEQAMFPEEGEEGQFQAYCRDRQNFQYWYYESEKVCEIFYRNAPKTARQG